MSSYPEDRSDRQSPSRDLPPGASCGKKNLRRLCFPTKDSYDILFTLSMTARSGLPIAHPARQSRTAEPGPLSSLLRRGDIFSPDIFFSCANPSVAHCFVFLQHGSGLKTLGEQQLLLFLPKAYPVGFHEKRVLCFLGKIIFLSRISV